MKKIISAIMSLSLLAGAAAMPVSAAETYSLGDVDMNGVVDTRDAVFTLGDYVGVWLSGTGDVLTAEQKVYADIDSNNRVDSADALGILNYYLYTVLNDSPVSADQFFADFVAYRNEMEQSENYDAASDQALQDANDFYHNNHDQL